MQKFSLVSQFAGSLSLATSLEDIVQLDKNHMINHFSVVVENIGNIASGKVYNIYLVGP